MQRIVSDLLREQGQPVHGPRCVVRGPPRGYLGFAQTRLHQIERRRQIVPNHRQRLEIRHSLVSARQPETERGNA